MTSKTVCFHMEIAMMMSKLIFFQKEIAMMISKTICFHQEIEGHPTRPTNHLARDRIPSLMSLMHLEYMGGRTPEAPILAPRS